MEKINIQCGYEDICKKKDCLNCRRQVKEFKLKLSLAEQIAVEDFAVCDLKEMIELKPKVIDLTQDVMRKIMKKVYNDE